MEHLWDVKPNLRHLLLSGLTQAATAIGHRKPSTLAPSFPGMNGADDCRLIKTRALSEKINQPEGIKRWPQQGLLTTRWPVLIFVLDGECDVRFGVTSEVRRHVHTLSGETGQYVVTARKNQFLLIPSHFPRPDGGGVHWERPDVENAASTLMWFIFLPTGCFVHFCKTQGREHTQTKSSYLSVAGAFRLIEEVENEVLGAQPQWRIAAHNYLQNLLLQLQRHVSGAQLELGISGAQVQDEDALDSSRRAPHLTLQRACLFIEDHLQESLRVAQIADEIGVSASGLNQLFRRYLQTSALQYVLSRRIERASTLLSETNLAVKLIAEQSGFPSLEHFSRTFHRATGASPLAYRRRYQKPE